MPTLNSKDGTLIAYNKSGTGDPVILVDGAIRRRDFGSMNALAGLLAPHFTVYNYDRRGRGESTDTQPYAVEREIEDLTALMQEAGGAAYVYGISSGAALVLEAAAHGLPMTKLALYEPPFIVDDSRPALPADYQTRLNALLADGQRGDASAYFMTAGIDLSADEVASMRQQSYWPMIESAAHTLAYDTAILMPYHTGAPLIPERWASITMPVLVMGGGASPRWMQIAAAATADALPGSRLLTLENQVHDVAVEAVAPLLVEFFTGDVLL